MEIGQRLAELSDKELESYHANATRLAQSGNDRQRQQAEELLPLLNVALEERRSARIEAQAETRRVNAEKRAAASKARKEKSEPSA